MDLLNSSWAAFVGFATISCSPIDISIFDEGGSDESPPPPIVINLGGAGSMDEPVGLGGAGGVEPFVIDRFDDGDSRGDEPAGWWYTVNDGTGDQRLSVVPAEEAPPGASVGGSVLRVEAEGFSDWGSAFGIDIADFDLSAGTASLTFRIVADAPVEVSFHAIDGTGDHFTRNLTVTTQWSLVEVRLDQMFIVADDAVRRFDLLTADELQWFRFDGAANSIWLDDVTLWSSANSGLP